MKRVTSGMLAVLLLLGSFFVDALPVSADPIDEVQETTQTTDDTAPATTDPTTGDSTENTTPSDSEDGTQKDEEDENKYTGPSISDEGMRILKLEEGFSKYPYKDYTQFTVGYGTRCPDEKLAEYQKNGISEEEAEILLRNHLIGVYNEIVSFADKNGITFSQNQFDALVLFSYNCGTGWMYENGTLPKAIKSGDTGNELIRAFTLWCIAGGEVQTFLLRRRQSEAYMYLEGGYLQTAPDNYCYVLYDANGGTVSPKSQGYNSDLTAKTYPTPTYSGYTFDGWYTQKNGGTKVTVLDASTKGKTLYAHWQGSQSNDPTDEEAEVNATVTGSSVNVRKGPGTNYTTVGVKYKGDKILITETASGSGYLWGKIDTGWICLTYTDYETADQEQEKTDQPDDSTGTDTTEPTTTPTTTPSGSTGTSSEMGTVKADGGLNIRSGTSTGHAIVGHLNNNDRVEILEQKTVGSIVWGRITQGWISMTYVKLDSDTSADDTGATPGDSNTTVQSWTGTIINCSYGLCIRSGAGTNYPIAGYLYTGDKVTVTEQKTNGSITWGKIDRGWISMEYVKLDTTDSTGSTDTATSQTGTITASSLCIRSYAGTASTVVGYLTKGSSVTITQTMSVNGTTWGKVDKGWISMDYVKLDSASGGTDTTQQSTTKTVTADCLCVRKTAGTGTIVNYLYYGTKVSILETTTVNGTTWGRISSGWICMDYVK